MITIRLEQPTNSPVALILRDAAGNIVISKTFSEAPLLEVALRTDGLPAGEYSLTASSGLHTIVRKVVVG